MTDLRWRIRGVTPEGLAREALQFAATRPDLRLAVALRAWFDGAGLSVDREREVRSELQRLRGGVAA